MKFNFLKRLAPYAPFLSAILIIGCVALALRNYEAPVYEVLAADENTQDAEVEPEETAEDDAERTLTGILPDVTELETEDEDAGTLNLAALEDGVYRGSGTGFAGTITVEVTVAEHQIVSIELLEVEADDAAYVAQAKAVVDRILAAQSLDVDTVSGATYSSRGILRAVRNALTGEADDGQTASGATDADAGSTGLGSTTLFAVKDAEAYTDGVYEGSATGFAGTITVEVTISGGEITKIQITETADDASYINNASAVLAKIIAAQSTNVDAVSGATYSSVGIINAVRDALSKAQTQVQTTTEEETAKENSGKFPYADGIYYGTAEGYNGDITVAVVLKDATIKVILITASSDDDAYLSRASALLDEIVAEQSVKVDAVSGATYSSNGLIQAVKKAIKAAKKAMSGTDSEAKDSAAGDSENKDGKNQDSENQDGEKDAGADSEETDGGAETEGVVYRNGTYNVTVLCSDEDEEDNFTYNLNLDVTVSGDRITAIENLTIVNIDYDAAGDSQNQSCLKRAADGTATKAGVVKQILTKGSADGIDAVSGATYSSDAIVEACREALSQAKAALEEAQEAEEAQ